MDRIYGRNHTSSAAPRRRGRWKDIIQQIIEAGHKDPLLTLSELHGTSADEAITRNRSIYARALPS